MPKHPSSPHSAHWEQRYACEDYLFGTEPNVFLHAHQALMQAGMSVLAVADGESRNGVWMARQGMQVLSLEVSANAIAKGKRLAEKHEVDIDFIQTDLMHWQWPSEKFDMIVAIFIQFLSGEERKQAFTAMKRALKPSGLFLLQGYTPKQLTYRTGGPSSIEQLYTKELLQELLDDMDILEMLEHESIMDEGIAHSGMSALIDVVARKTV